MSDNSAIKSLGLDQSYTSLPTTETRKKDELGQNEFLQLLITQLKNQDPLEPSDPQEFAVNLAQFTQVGELIKLNQTLSKQADTTAGIASYLGTEVTLPGDEVSVSNYDGGLIKVDLADNVNNLSIELVKADGSVQEVTNSGPLEKGKHTIALNDLQTATGTFTVKVTAQGTSGETYQVQAKPAGIVTGFIPGADPSLIVNGNQVKPADVVEVNLPPYTSGE